VKLLCSLALFAAIAFGDPIYTITSLGQVGGSSSTTGYAVNDAGAVAGWSQNSSGVTQAFGSGAGGLASLPLGSGTVSYAYGINDAGTVVGDTYIGGQSHATIWSGSSASPRVLGANSYAMAVNVAGEVAGASNGQAMVVVDGQVQSLGTLAGVNWSAAYGINNAGEVVGEGELANGTFRGVVWGSGGGAVLVGTFGGGSSDATGVNDSGEVVGFASLASGYQNAFLMTGGAMTDLGTLGESSYAYGVNDSGENVGYSYLDNGAQHAFLYDDGTMLDLNSLLPANSGWVLEEAFGINSAGQITGMGLYDGQQTAFLMTDPAAIGAVPEPSVVLLMAAGMGLMALMRASARGQRV